MHSALHQAPSIADSHHETPHIYKLSQLLQAIKSLLSPDLQQRQQAQKLLLEQRQKNYGEFVHQFIQLIIYTHQDQDKYLCLLYLRNLFSSYSKAMPDFVAFLQNQIAGVPAKMKDLAVDCMCVYLNKPLNLKYKKHYIDALVTKLVQSINLRTLNICLIKTVTLILGHSSQAKKSGYIFSNANQKMIHQILTKFCMGWPYGADQPVSKEWARFILALCNYTGFLPSSQFVYTNLMDEGGDLGVDQIVRLTQLYNKMHNMYSDVGQVYKVLGVQLNRLRSQQFRKKLDEVGDDGDSFKAIVRSIQYAIVDILSMKCREKQPTPEQQAIFNQLMNVNFLSRMAGTLLGIPQLTLQQKHPIYELISSLIEKYQLLTTNPTIVYSYINSLTQQLQDQGKQGVISIYELMGNVQVNIMKYFQYSNVIAEGVNQIMNNNWKGWECFMQMIVYYMKNLDETYQWEETKPNIAKLIKYCLSITTTTPPHLKPLTFAIICQYQLISYKKANNSNLPTDSHIKIFQYKEILKIGYDLLTQLLSAEELDSTQCIDEESLEMVLEGLRDLSMGIDDYLDYFHCSLINYIRDGVLVGRKSSLVNIYIEFISIMDSYLQIKYIQDNSLINIAKIFLQSSNEALQYRSCELILHILVLTNRHWHQKQLPLSQTHLIVNNILSTQLLPYIQSNFIQENDQCLFSKILIELVIHQPAYYPIKQMLQRVTAALPNCLSFSYCFDRVWEVMVIVYADADEYVGKKCLGKRVEEIKIGKMETMFETMNIEDQENMEKVYTMKKVNKNYELRWSDLPDVRRVLEDDSVVGQYINKKIHNPLY